MSEASSHASCNPLQLKILPVSNPLGKDREARRKVNKSKKDALLTDYEAFNRQRLEEMQALAVKHNKPLSQIQANLSVQVKMTKPHGGTLHNALVHFESKRLSTGLPKGSRIPNKEVQKVAKERTAEISDTKAELIVQKFKEVLAVCQQGARATNCATTTDFMVNTKQFQEEYTNIGVRTSARGFGILMCGHIADNMGTTFLCTNDSVWDFFIDVFKKTVVEVRLLFDAWSLARTEKGIKEMTLTMKKECCKAISEGLNVILGKKTIEMRYTNYDMDICDKYNVQLCGWPLGPAKKPRKERSDKNKPHGPQKCKITPSTLNKGKENEPLRKKAKTAAVSAQLPPMLKSKPFINDSDDDDNKNNADGEDN
ncbi:hypothetical protein NP233_g10533 [Leucocoprinus birnbaumii]|uniref:Uncharacterized protein n=1 Tax=Leucocoprinus birnbaumii TaxID=56174 RepID=A0AAD5VI44_9AGAR|nr:hypothetical protein NP233_g10533 [Leucocoprinus birnbaumii]